MTTLKKLRNWLRRPQVTNRDALVVGLVGGVATWILLWVAGQFLELLDLVEFDDSVPVWVAALAAGLGLMLGLMAAVGARSRAGELATEVNRLGTEADELRQDRRIYDTYAEHLRDALGDLRRVIAGELPALSLRDFIERCGDERRRVYSY